MIKNVRTEDNQFLIKKVYYGKYDYVLSNFPNNCFDICIGNKTISIKTLIFLKQYREIRFYFFTMQKNQYNIILVKRILSTQKEETSYNGAYYTNKQEVEPEYEEWVNTYVKNKEGTRIIAKYIGI